MRGALLLVLVSVVAVCGALQRVNPTIAADLWDVNGVNGSFVVAGGACSPNNILNIGLSSDLVHWTSSDVTEIPNDQCVPLFNMPNQAWAVAADTKLGYAIFNGLSFLTSHDGKTWTWHNQTLLQEISEVICDGKGTCIGYEENSDDTGFVITHDLISWSPIKATNGYINVINGTFYSFSQNKIYAFNLTALAWLLHMDLTNEMKRYQDATVTMFRAAPGGGFYLIGSIGTTFYKMLFVISADGKIINDVAEFESNCRDFYAANGVIVTYSSTAFNVTNDLGATWKSTSCFPVGTTNQVCTTRFVNGKFVVVGQNGLFLSSEDGFTWTSVTNSINGNIAGITLNYGNSFIAFSTNPLPPSYTTYTSANGLQWQTGVIVETPAYFNYPTVPTYYEGVHLWVAMFFNSSSYQTFPRVSADLNTWTPLKLPCPDSSVVNIVYGNGLWMMSRELTNPNYTLSYSYVNDTTGTWIDKATPPPREYGAPMLVFGNGIFVALSGNFSLATQNTKTWETGKVPVGCDFLQFVGELFFCGSAFRPPLGVSSDGVTWTTISYPSAPFPRSSFILFDGSQYIVSASYSDVMLASTDGIKWQQSPSINYYGVNFSTYNGKVAVIAGVINNEIFVNA